MDCRVACDLSVVRHHRIYRKLSGDMLGACASAMTVSDCPHGQEKKILQRKLSPKMPPHGAFQPNPHRRGHRQGQEIKSAFSFDYDHEASQPAATPQACRPGGHSPGPARPGCSRTPPGPQEGAGTGADRPNAATEKSTFYKRNDSCDRTMDSKSTRDFQSIGVSQGGGFSNILAARIYLACLVGK